MTVIGTIFNGEVPENLEGILLSSRRGTIGATAPARRWMDWVERHADPMELEFGKRISRKHQVYFVQVVQGTMIATVAEVRADPMRVSIGFQLPSDDFGDAFLQSLLGEPIAIAALFANREPDNFERLVEASGGVMPPEGMNETRCTCGVTFCRHAVAAHCAFAEKLDESPWLCLELLGRSRASLCNAVRESWGDAPIPDDQELKPRPVDTSRPFYGDVVPEDAAFANLPSFDVIERLGAPPFFPVDERNVKRTIEKLYHD